MTKNELKEIHEKEEKVDKTEPELNRKVTIPEQKKKKKVYHRDLGYIEEPNK